MILCEDAQHPIEFNLGLTNLVVLPTVEVSFLLESVLLCST